MKGEGPAAARTLLDDVVRANSGRLTATLIRELGDFQLAEDCLQDSVESALVHWSRNGTPWSPAGWLLQTARRKAIDRLRRATNFRRKEGDIARLIALDRETLDEPEEHPVPDERLSLIFTCCHPAIERKARVALTLRTLGGLSTAEIARAFIDTEAAMAQRLVRAKGKIRAAGIPFRIPEGADLPERLPAVLDVIYLIFNEGYAASSGEEWVRTALCEEAIRLARLVAGMTAVVPEARGLLALLLLNAARLPARAEGARLVPLDEQDRALWHRDRIEEGRRLVRETLNARTAGPFLIQAAISALHCEATDLSATDWPQIVRLYDELIQRADTPIIRLNRLVALSFAADPAAALDAMTDLAVALADYQPFHAARADLARRCGRIAEARSAYERAIALTRNAHERAFLADRMAGLAEG